MTWDDEGNMYILTAGNDFLPEQETKMSIMELKADGSNEEIVNLNKQGIKPDFITDDKDDMVLTGAFVPFGEETSPGQVIKGVELASLRIQEGK